MKICSGSPRYAIAGRDEVLVARFRELNLQGDGSDGGDRAERDSPIGPAKRDANVTPVPSGDALAGRRQMPYGDILGNIEEGISK